MLGPHVIKAEIFIFGIAALPLARASHARQPQEVYDVIGPRGEKLTGPLVHRNANLLGGSTRVEATKEIDVGPERLDRQVHNDKLGVEKLHQSLKDLEAALVQATANGSVSSHEFYKRWVSAKDSIRDQYRSFQVAQPILWIDQMLNHLETRRWYHAVGKNMKNETPENMEHYRLHFEQASTGYDETQRLLARWLEDLRD